MLKKLKADNLGYYAGVEPELAEKWLEKHYPILENFLAEIKKYYPERLELSFAIITDHSISEYREICKQYEPKEEL